MEGKYYTSERNVQILVYLLKAHNIKRVIASPGTTNITFVASIQQDPYFELYSCVDERSAAYMACGIAEESGEPVVITCTGATASRNYLPGLTEAYYRKLPVLAITATQDISRIGQLVPQVIDRRQPLNDIVLVSEQINLVRDKKDEDDVTVRINRALLELRHRGGGPVHINLTTAYSRDYSVKSLPEARVIRRICSIDNTFPIIPSGSKVGIYIGSHREFTDELTIAVDRFCSQYNAVAFCDHTSGYHGNFRILSSIVNSQDQFRTSLNDIDILVHIGEVSGDYPNDRINPKEVWRVSEDGELRDKFHKLSYVFEMKELTFFTKYSTIDTFDDSFFQEWQDVISNARNCIPELPFSNIWIAQNMSQLIPDNSVVYLGILNTLRSWNLFDMAPTVHVSSNTGGFGIDGGVSSLTGASLNSPDRLHFMFTGDLAFFYDLNVIGNRHIGNNVRILLVNNGKGTEFRMFNHPGAQFEEEADEYIAAARHFGNMSKKLVKHIAEDLGFSYMKAENKQDFIAVLPQFVDRDNQERPIIFEVFTNCEDESDSLYIMRNLIVCNDERKKPSLKDVARKVIGDKGIEIIKIIKS